MTEAQTFDSYLPPSNRDLHDIPGDYGLPLVGSTFAMLRDPVGTFGRHYERFGPVSRISITGEKCLLVVGPEHAQRVLLDRERNFSSRGGWMTMMGDFFRGSLAVRDYEDHRLHRRVMQTAFTPDAMRVYVDKVHAITRAAVQDWADQRDILLYDEVKKLLLTIAFEIFCWDPANKDMRPEINRAFTDMMVGALAVVRRDWPGLLYRRGLDGRRFLFDYFKSLVAKKRVSDDSDVFAHFCRETTEDGQYFAERDLADHMVFLMLAAHDTTTSATTMAAYYLVHDPELQRRLVSEIDAAGHPLSYDAMFREMTMMEGVFYEALRMHPPVTIQFRRTLRECVFDGKRIPARTMVCVSNIYNHFMKEWWTEPERFDPLRFSKERTEHRQHAFLWTPFGGGAHKCIGMHFARILLMSTFADLLRNYEIRFTKDDYFPAKLQQFPFAKPRDNLPITLVPR